VRRAPQDIEDKPTTIKQQARKIRSLRETSAAKNTNRQGDLSVTDQ
jgi:hypothetical protein